MQEEDVKLPQEVQTQMAAYAARFSIVKTPRKLIWRKHLGSVDLSLTVGGQEVDFTVAPIQAAVIMRFKVDQLAFPSFRGLLPHSAWRACPTRTG